jgi:hypothetical protein
MMPTKTSVGPKEVVRLGVLRLTPPLLYINYMHGSHDIRQAICDLRTTQALRASYKLWL